MKQERHPSDFQASSRNRSPLTGRRRLWDTSCFTLDALLCTSFDPDELLALDSKFRCMADLPDCSAVRIPRSLQVYGVAHKACHTDNPISRHIERRLDAMHEGTLRECERLEKLDVLTRCYAAAEEAREDLPGFLWAVVTDSRSEIREQGLFWIEGIVIRALLHWMSSWKDFRGMEIYRRKAGREGPEGAGG